MTTCRNPAVRRDDSDAVRVDRVDVVALAGGEHSGLRLRRNVHYGLALGDQVLGDVPADAVVALDSPRCGRWVSGGPKPVMAPAPRTRRRCRHITVAHTTLPS
ncbi:hypothetical protein Ari01nite_94270 [Paractinoplanes rishiriensis]|uniref:Uncharacterized protein n=1 Tax=Paractinoplanes rishiriensis TaxID=1050105 RepID=A0A919N2U5_9ACTN|nr:hypothetical protein Ari01nite_94270 [Actinoplanes rishiriensis]